MSWAHDNRDGNDGGKPRSRRNAPYNRDGGGGGRGGRVVGVKLTISGLRPAYTWQELKEAFSDAGAILRADVDGEGGGVVTYREGPDAAWAMKNWNGVKFAGKAIKIVHGTPAAAAEGKKGGRGAKEGGRGAKAGGRDAAKVKGAKGGRDRDEKPATSADLDSQMEAFWGKTDKGKAKVAELKAEGKAKVAESLDDDLDSFMAKRADAAKAEPEAAADAAEAPAATEAAAETA